MRYHLTLLLLLSFLFSCKDQDKKNENIKQKKVADVETNLTLTDTTACIFSEIAYCSDPQQQLDKYLPGWKVVWNPLAVRGNHGFVAANHDNDTYVIAFRGSLITFSEDAFNNWIANDLNVASQEHWPYSNEAKTSISKGSYIGWQNLEEMKDKVTGKTLWAFLSENGNGKFIVLTGHSLGGNLATVYASYLQWKAIEAKLKIIINVITFAAPAPGNKYFADEFNTNFQYAIRVENTNDIVPKFPCSSRIRKLSDLYSPLPSADSIMIGYRNIRTSISNAFSAISDALDVAEIATSFSGYKHTCGDGELITIPLSGKNTTNQPASWFAEAGYQHGMAQYAAAFGAPVIDCK
jgi:triacylglycerol lipase